MARTQFTRYKPRNFAPYDSALGQETLDHLNWLTQSVNQLLGQDNAPSGAGINALEVNSIDPSTAQLLSVGSRPYSIATPITAVATTTTITFYWDGTNGSQVFQVGRDDGTNFGPSIAGSPMVVTGLTINTNYFFYPYFDESINQIKFVNIPLTSVGTPAIAFTAKSFAAAQQHILRGRIPLAGVFVSTGVSTTAGGSVTTQGGNGGGAGAIGAKYL